MATIQKHLSQMQALWGEQQQLEEEAQKRAREIQKLVEGTRQALRAGGTTGDHILDLVLQAHGYDLVLTEAFREVETMIEDRHGELIVLLFSVDDSVIRISDYRPDNTVTQMERHNFTAYRYRLGVLDTSSLVLAKVGALAEERVITLPVSSFVEGEVGELSLRKVLPKRISANIFTRSFSESGYYPPFLVDYLIRKWGHDGVPAIPVPLSTSKPYPYLEQIVVGDYAVAQWLEKVEAPTLLKPLRRLFSRRARPLTAKA